MLKNIFYRGDQGNKSSRIRTRSRSRSNEKPKVDDSGLSFDPTNLDKVFHFKYAYFQN